MYLTIVVVENVLNALFEAERQNLKFSDISLHPEEWYRLRREVSHSPEYPIWAGDPTKGWLVGGSFTGVKFRPEAKHERGLMSLLRDGQVVATTIIYQPPTIWERLLL